jgi:hypothetical protein
VEALYRINLYPEFREKKQRAKRRLAFTAGLSVLVGLEVVLIVWLAVSAYLLDERADRMRDQIGRLSTSIEALDKPTPELDTADQILTIRRARIDWSPKLSALSCLMNRSLMLDELKGQRPEKGNPARLELTGSILGSRTAGTEAVSRLIEEIRQDPRIVGDLPRVTLERIEGGGSNQFQLVCESP